MEDRKEHEGELSRKRWGECWVGGSLSSVSDELMRAAYMCSTRVFRSDVDLRELPEYHGVLDAIESYKLAIWKEIDKKYGDSK